MAFGLERFFKKKHDPSESEGSVLANQLVADGLRRQSQKLFDESLGALLEGDRRKQAELFLNSIQMDKNAELLEPSSFLNDEENHEFIKLKGLVGHTFPMRKKDFDIGENDYFPRDHEKLGELLDLIDIRSRNK